MPPYSRHVRCVRMSRTVDSGDAQAGGQLSVPSLARINRTLSQSRFPRLYPLARRKRVTTDRWPLWEVCPAAHGHMPVLDTGIVLALHARRFIQDQLDVAHDLPGWHGGPASPPSRRGINPGHALL